MGFFKDVWNFVSNPVQGLINTVGGAIIGDAMSDANASQAFERQYQLQKDSQAFNAEQAQLSRDYNTAERQAAQQFTIDMYNRNNAYNTPQAQLERLRSAGINPLSQFPSVAANAPAASPQASSSPAQSGMGTAPLNSYYPNIDVAQSSVGISQSRLLDSQKQFQDIKNGVELQRAAAEIIEKIANAKEKLASANLHGTEADELREKIKVYEKQLKVMDSEMYKNYINANNDTTRTHTDYQRMQNEYDIALRELFISGKKVSIEQFDATTRRILANSQVDLNNHQIDLICANINEVAAKISEIGATIGVINEEKAKVAAEKVIEETKAQFAKDHPNWYIAADVLGSLLSTLTTTGLVGAGMMLGRKVAKPIKGFGR